MTRSIRSPTLGARRRIEGPAEQEVRNALRSVQASSVRFKLMTNVVRKFTGVYAPVIAAVRATASVAVQA